MKTTLRRVGSALLKGLAAFLAISVMAVVALRWLDPPGSSFMLRTWVDGWLEGRSAPWVDHQWVPWDKVAPAVGLAFVAAEDQRFPDHGGFDLVEMERAWRDYRQSGRLRGASTLTQQVAKNLFLWPEKSLVRKGLEAWFTLLIELTWSKRRILEVYVNIAQLGPDIYGVGAASRRYFAKRAAALSNREAALLAAVLPNPVRYRAEAPSPYVRQRAAWIQRQMRQLGPGHLAALSDG